MKRVAIIGGETHIGEITQLAGEQLEIVGGVVREDQRGKAEADFKAPIFADESDPYAQARPGIVAVANENDKKASAVLRALEEGCDVVVDKPLAIEMAEQGQIENYLDEHSERRLLMLLTLRGSPLWAAMREQVHSDDIGSPDFCHVRI